MQKSSTYVQEMHAITATVAKFQHYLLSHHFIIQMDHRSLNLSNSKATTSKIIGL